MLTKPFFLRINCPSVMHLSWSVYISNQ